MLQRNMKTFGTQKFYQASWSTLLKLINNS